MKSIERHKLETNWLAKRLNVWIEKTRPYVPTILGSVIAVIVVIIAWNWISGASAARQNEAWDIYNALVGSRSLNQQSLTELNRLAEEYQDTAMHDVANMTWADGQVWSASFGILTDRAAATESLNKATSAYQAVIDTSSDKDLVDRAHFGMARIYELRGDADKARAEYLKVERGFARLAKQRADELAKEKTKKTLLWLATAEAPRVVAPRGSGTPGQRPIFDVEDFALPGAAGETGGATPAAGETSIEELLKGFNQLGAGTEDTKDRYPVGEVEPGAAVPIEQPKTDDEKSKTEGGATTPAESKAATPGTPTTGGAAAEPAGK